MEALGGGASLRQPGRGRCGLAKPF